MGGVQSGTHNLGEALWVQERQRQKCHRWVTGSLIMQHRKRHASDVDTRDKIWNELRERNFSSH